MLNRFMDTLFDLTRNKKRLVVFLSDWVLIAFSYYLSVALVNNSLVLDFTTLNLSHLFTSILVTFVTFAAFGLYKTVTRYISLRILVIIAVSSLVSAVVTLLVSNFWRSNSFSLASAIVFGSSLCLTVGGLRLLIRAYFSARFNTQKDKVIIYGAGAAGQQLALSLANGTEYYPVAFIDDDSQIQNTYVQGIKVYPSDELKRLTTYFDATKILLALPSLSKSRRKQIISLLEPLGVPIQTIPGVKDLVEGKMKIDEFHDVEIDDLLGRDSVPPREELLKANIFNKTVMVTGAGGSIGSELCRQIIKLNPQRLLLLEVSEFALYAIEKELKEAAKISDAQVKVLPFLGTIQNKNRLKNILSAYKVDTLYHAAAYKHVPMVEYNVVEGVRNNVFGTLHTAQAAIESQVETFVLVSTDKAVRPTNVMGATKRMAELVLQALANKKTDTRFCMVRFGNVLGSSGSVVPLFKKQIKQGGPVTVTHPDIIRYFMTIPEAAQLVIQAGAMGKGGDVFVLDMGEPVKIADLARKIISLMGLEVKDIDNLGGDIEIEFTGLRPGEKLYEELLIGEDVEGTDHPRIMTANEQYLQWVEMEKILEHLDKACHNFEHQTIRNILLNAPTGFDPSDGICDLVWSERMTHNVVDLPPANKNL